MATQIPKTIASRSHKVKTQTKPLNPYVAKKPTVLVTGAAGMIGSRLLASLKIHYEVVAFDIQTPAYEEDDISWIECDLTEEASVAHAFELLRQKHGNTLACVIHLAAYYDFSGESCPLYETLNVEGTRRLLHGLKPFDVEQFIFASTLLVMKPARLGEVLTESSELQVEWDYPRSKLDAERYLAEKHGKMPVLVLRLAGVYDEDCRCVPIAHQIKSIHAKEKESAFLPENAKAGQSFIHLDDVVDCLLLAVNKRNQLRPYELLLVGEPEAISYGELQDLIGHTLHGPEWMTLRIPKAVDKVGTWVEERALVDEDTFVKPWAVDVSDSNYPIDPSRLRDRFGWEPQHSLRDMLGIMLQRLMENPQRWYEANYLPMSVLDLDLS